MFWKKSSAASTSKDEFSLACSELDDAMKKFSIKESSLNEFYWSRLRSIELHVKRLSLQNKPNKKRLLIIIREILFVVNSTDENNSIDYLRDSILNLEDEIDLYKRDRLLFVFKPILFFTPKFSIRIRRAFFSNSLLTKIISGLYVSGFTSLVLLIASASIAYMRHANYVEEERSKLEENIKEFNSEIKNYTEYKGFLNSRKEEIRVSLDNSIAIDSNELPDGINILPDLSFIGWKSLNIRDIEQGVDKLDNLIEEKRESIATTQIDALRLDTKISLEVNVFFVVVIVMTSGTLGSIISIFIRVQEFDQVQEKYSDPLTPILIGVFKPLIGASFAIFLWALINSQIISSKLFDDSNAVYFYITISFVAGFSERLVKDLIEKTERSIFDSVSSSLDKIDKKLTSLEKELKVEETEVEELKGE